MNEQEWPKGNDTGPLQDFLRGKASDRKLRLFGVACCRCLPGLHRRSLATLEVVERFADGVVRAVRLRRAWEAADAFALSIDDALDEEARPEENSVYEAALAVAWAAMPSDDFETVEVVAHAAFWAASARPEVAGAAAQARLFDEIVPPPGVEINRGWLSAAEGVVPALAQGIYDERAFDRLPILADALEDAGCMDTEILGHLRGPGPHARGCWVLDLLLGKE